MNLFSFKNLQLKNQTKKGLHEKKISFGRTYRNTGK